VKTSILLFASLCSIPSALAQSGRPIPAGVRQADEAEAQSQKNLPPPLYQRRSIDAAKLKQEAADLANLSQSIPLGVEQATRGIISKDLSGRLKRIEKLARQLRSEISP
jgi:hypothetical protein